MSPRARTAALAIVLALVAASAAPACRRAGGHRARRGPRVTQAHPFNRAPVNDVDGDGLADVLVSDAPLGALLLRGARREPLSSVAWRWTVRPSDPARTRAGAMAFTGDLDGDRRSEVAVAEVSAGEGDPCAHGGVRVYRGAPAGLSAAPAWTLEAPPPMGEGTDHYALMGAHLARVEHLDGPGEHGLVVSARRTRVVIDGANDRDGSDGSDGAPHARRSEFCQGDELWVYRGAARTPSQRIFVAQGEVLRVVAGRVDRDAHADLVVLAPPKVLVFRGRPGGFADEPAVTLDDPHDDPQRWSDVAVGDVDGDGDGEVVLTFQYSSGAAGVAEAGIVHHDVLSPMPRVSALSAPTADGVEGAVGRSVLVLPDADGDRRDEVVIADPTMRAVFVYRGRAEDGWSAPDRVLRVPESAGALGVTMTLAGDIDGDRRTELVVRAARDDGGMSTLFWVEPLRGELARVSIAPGPEGFGQSLAGAGSSVGGPGPRPLPPLPRRCEVPSAEREPARLVRVSLPLVRAEAARIEAALTARLGALAACQERSLREDCNRRARASLTLQRASDGAVTVGGVAWLEGSDDALRDCVQQAVSGPLLTAARAGAEGAVALQFLEGP